MWWICFAAAQIVVFTGTYGSGALGGTRAALDSICVAAAGASCETTQTFAMVGFPTETPMKYGLLPSNNQSFNSSMVVYSDSAVVISNTWSELWGTTLVNSFTAANVVPAASPTDNGDFYWNMDSNGEYLFGTNEWCSGLNSAVAQGCHEQGTSVSLN